MHQFPPHHFQVHKFFLGPKKLIPNFVILYVLKYHALCTKRKRETIFTSFFNSFNKQGRHYFFPFSFGTQSMEYENVECHEVQDEFVRSEKCMCLKVFLVEMEVSKHLFVFVRCEKFKYRKMMFEGYVSDYYYVTIFCVV